MASGTTGSIASPIDGRFGPSGRVYGFEIKLALSLPILYTLSARVQIPGGGKMAFESVFPLDLRFPLGGISSVGPHVVEGWAVSAQAPNDPYVACCRPLLSV